MTMRKKPNTKKTMNSLIVQTFLKFVRYFLNEEGQKLALDFVTYYKIEKEETAIWQLLYAFTHDIQYHHTEKLKTLTKDGSDILCLNDEYKYYNDLKERRIQYILENKEEVRTIIKTMAEKTGYKETCLDWLMND